MVSKIVEQALDLARKTDLSSDADKVEGEAESKAEATYKGRSEEKSRELAREVLLRAMALAGSQPQPKKVIGTRYERGPVGVAATVLRTVRLAPVAVDAERSVTVSADAVDAMKRRASSFFISVLHFRYGRGRYGRGRYGRGQRRGVKLAGKSLPV